MFFSKERQGFSRILIVEEVVATVDRFRDAKAVIGKGGAISLLIVDIALSARLRCARCCWPESPPGTCRPGSRFFRGIEFPCLCKKGAFPFRKSG